MNNSPSDIYCGTVGRKMQFLRKCSLATCKLQLSIKDVLIAGLKFSTASKRNEFTTYCKKWIYMGQWTQVFQTISVRQIFFKEKLSIYFFWENLSMIQFRAINERWYLFTDTNTSVHAIILFFDILKTKKKFRPTDFPLFSRKKKVWTPKHYSY